MWLIRDEHTEVQFFYSMCGGRIQAPVLPLSVTHEYHQSEKGHLVNPISKKELAIKRGVVTIGVLGLYQLYRYYY